MSVPIIIENVLSPSSITTILANLARVSWRNGADTAGAIAGEVKRNLQADEKQTLTLRQTVARVLMEQDELFRAIVRPQVVSLMFSRYDEGAEYGLHIDSAQMISGLRRDVSFTIFLSAPETYKGGELIIESPLAEQSYRLAAGSMVLYPATALHRVTRVESGSRVVVVGWARSLVRDPEKRELLFELDAVKSALYDRLGKSNEVDVLSKCSANLMRMWMED